MTTSKHARFGTALFSALISRLTSDEEALSSLNHITSVIGQAFDAAACVMWEIRTAGRGREQVESCFPIGVYTVEGLFSSSISALSEERIVTVAKNQTVLNSTYLIPSDHYLSAVEQLRGLAICAVPVSGITNQRIVLSIYSTTKAWLTRDIKDLQLLARMIPLLYSSRRENAMVRISKMFYQGSHRSLSGIDAEASINLAAAITSTLASIFDCEEASLILSSDLGKSFILEATTWPHAFDQPIYRLADDGLTNYVLSKSQSVLIRDLRSFEDSKFVSKIYPGIKWTDSMNARSLYGNHLDVPFSFMAAPIVYSGRVLGAIRCFLVKTAPHAFSSADTELLSTLAQTVGHLFLSSHLIKAAEDSRRALEAERKSFRQDQAHQLKSPIAFARVYADKLCAEFGDSPSSAGRSSRAIRGLLRKVSRVLQGTIMFSNLSMDESLTVHPKPLSRDQLVRFLAETVIDAREIVNPATNVTVSLERSSFDILSSNEWMADFVLVEQAITALIDNAVKYSFANTTIRISGGITGSGDFYVSVTNHGIPFSQEDLKNVGRRGWRGELAREYNKGAGLGLWIVTAIMKAHNGRLLINASDRIRPTVVRLLFPPREKKQ